jgi:DNA-binding GntR family transcriptional regulator
LATSRNAVREALRILAQEGLVVREPGRGTIVSGKILEFATSDFTPAGSPDGGQSDTVKVEPIEHRVVPTTSVVGSRLETSEAEVMMIEQLATFEGQAMYVRAGYLRLDSAPQSLFAQVADQGYQLWPLSVAFESLFGVPFGLSETIIEARACEERTSRLLGIPEGSPVLMREVLLRDRDGVPRELSYTHYRADRVCLSVPSLGVASVPCAVE